jgi:hypothetical protein
MALRKAQQLAKRPGVTQVVHALIFGKLEQWHHEGALEGILGQDFDNTNQTLETICAGGVEPHALKPSDVVQYLIGLEECGEVRPLVATKGKDRR